MNIIARIEEPTDWVNSIAVVEKPNSNLRICIDPRNLNKAIKRPHYVIPKTTKIHPARCQQRLLAVSN